MDSDFGLSLLNYGIIMAIAAIFLAVLYFIFRLVKIIPLFLKIIFFRIKGWDIVTELEIVAMEIENRRGELREWELKSMRHLFQKADCFIHAHEKFLKKKMLERLHMAQGRISSEYEQRGGNLIAPLTVHGL